MLSKLLNIIKSSQYHIFLASCIGLIAFISYNLGQIEALEKTPIKISDQGVKTVAGSLKAEIFRATDNKGNSTINNETKLDTRVVVSKASTSKKYHYTWCPGAKKINESNKLWFSSDKEAEVAGYILAGNCSK